MLGLDRVAVRIETYLFNSVWTIALEENWLPVGVRVWVRIGVRVGAQFSSRAIVLEP